MKALAKYVKKSDIIIFNLFNQKLSCSVLDMLMKKITHMGSLVFSLLLPVILIFSKKQSLTDAGIQILATLTLSSTIVQTIKRIVDRPRPFKVLNCLTPGKVPSSQYSFPSGHTCAAFSAAFVLAAAYTTFSIVFIALAALVAISRVYLGYHYPTDIVVGTGIAYISFLINLKIF